jgi:small-conductance mechanosensitive channel
VLDRAGETLGGYLPRFAGAIALLLIGLVVVSVVRRLVRRALVAAGLDALAERWGVHDVIERFGMPRSLAAVLAGAVRIGLVIVVLFASLSLLGLEFLSQSLNAGILFLPQLFVALVLLLVGLVLSELARRQMDRLAAQMDLPGPLGALAQILVLALFGVTALGQLGIPIEVLMLLAGILLAAAALTLALAFGLGGREMAREVSARRYVEGSYEVGQEVSVGGVRGRIEAIEATSTLLRTSEGERLRIPNSQLISAVVTLHGGG